MTQLRRIVKREALRANERGRPIIVSLEPGDLISFRAKGCRKVYRTTLEACWLLAVRAEVEEQRRLKRTRK